VKALVVGGTGPTGPYIVDGLRGRGYEVTLFHRGTHEVEGQEDLEHIHGDPHFPDTIRYALGDRRWNIVVATYGRVRHIANAVAGRCEHFIGIGGIMVYRGFTDPLALAPPGMALESHEGAQVMSDVRENAPKSSAFAHAIFRTEQEVMQLGRDGAFSATYFRYPQIYGPRVFAPAEWSVVRRIRDGRDYMVLPDHGLAIKTRCAARNAAHMVLLGIDRPSQSAGAIFNCRDDVQFSLRQWVHVVSTLAGREISMVSIPCEFAWPAWGLALSRTDDHHDLVSHERARRLLGYADVVDPTDGLREAVSWLHKNEPESHRFEGRDEFDYAGEDELVDSYRRALQAVVLEPPADRRRHSYPHPRRPGEKVDHRGQ
jgi:nucleoside-diphosphate-sugar epimerase